MKISAQLPQFRNAKVLIAVSSSHDAKFYVAENGEIKEREQYHIDNPKYEDREEFFAKSSGGKFLGGGSVYENKKNYLENRMINRFRERIVKIANDEKISEIYLFFPKKMQGLINKYLPDDIHLATCMHVFGNHVDVHPMELLKKIDTVFLKTMHEKMPSQMEALKILQKSLRARKIMGS